MNRRVWATAAIAAGWVGGAIPAADAPLPAAGEIITLRTSGQPERKVKVLKAERTADGTVLTDVKDLNSGMVYTLTDSRGMTPTKPAEPTPSEPKSTLPPTGKPSSATMQALTHDTWGKPPTPLFGGTTKPPARSTPKSAPPGPAARTREIDPLLAAAAAKRTEPPAPAKPTTLLGRLFGTEKPSTPAPRVGGGAATPVAKFGPPVGLPAKAEAGLIRPTAYTAPPTTYTPPPAARLQLVPADNGPVRATEPLRTSAVVRQPSVPAALAADPLPAPKPVAPPVAVEPPTAVAAETPPAADPPPFPEPVLTVAPPVLTPSAAVEPPPALSPAEPVAPTVRPEPVTPEPVAPTAPATPPPAVVAQPSPFEDVKPPAPPLVPLPAMDPVAPPRIGPPVLEAVPAALAPLPPAETPATDDQMRAELTPLVQTLRTHARPRFRLDAASALANGPYGKRPEVQAVILDAARNDESPVLRGHCIRLLSQLGVTDPTFQDDLLKWANDREPAISRAAGDALQKLAGK